LLAEAQRAFDLASRALSAGQDSEGTAAALASRQEAKARRAAAEKLLKVAARLPLVPQPLMLTMTMMTMTMTMTTTTTTTMMMMTMTTTTTTMTMTMMMMMMMMMTMMGPETPHCLTFSLHVPLWRPVPHPPRAVEAP